MKSIRFFAIVLFAMALVVSCEKVVIASNGEEDETEKVEKPGDEDQNEGSDSNSGTGTDNSGGNGSDSGSESGDGSGSGNGDTGKDDDNIGSGDESGGSKTDGEVDVNTFITSPFKYQVWIKGYIVGCATGANQKYRYDFEPPFEFATALLLADNPNETNVSNVASVRLVNGSKRDILNLMDNPENHGQKIRVFGYQATYLKIPGIKDIDAYEFPVKD